MRRFAKPLYGLTPVPRVRIPPSPPDLSTQSLGTVNRESLTGSPDSQSTRGIGSQEQSMRVSIYNRRTIGGRRQYFLAHKTSTGPFYLRYVMNGVRKWHPANTSSYSLALASAKQIEATLLTEKEIAPKPSPEAPKSFEELRTAFIHDKKTT